MLVRTSSLPSSSVAITETEPLALSEPLTLIDAVSPTFSSVPVTLVEPWLSESVNDFTFSLRITVACTEFPDCSN